MSELDQLKREVSSLKEELNVMKGNVRELNEQLYNSYKRIKILSISYRTKWYTEDVFAHDRPLNEN
jgi:hypothetical protein